MSEVFLMDCMEGMKQYPDNYFDLAVVDPPYGIDADKNQAKRASELWKGYSGGQWKTYNKTEWDSNIPSLGYFIELKRVSKNQIIWGGNYYPIDMVGVIVWNKGENGTLPHGEMAKTNFKTFKIFYISRADAYINNCDSKIHPTQKPVKLYDWIYKNYLPDGGKVLDTHLGSGSNRIAAEKAGNIDFVGYEIDKDYFDASVKRYNQFKSQLCLSL